MRTFVVTRFTRSILAAGTLAAATVAGACSPTPPTGPWTFRASQVTVISGQDAVYDPVLGTCTSVQGCSDEPYVLSINFTALLASYPAVAFTWVTGSSANATMSLANGQSAPLAGPAAAMASFDPSIRPENYYGFSERLWVVGAYVWAVEGDANDISAAASTVATELRTALALNVSQTHISVLNIASPVITFVNAAFEYLDTHTSTLNLSNDLIGAGLYVGLNLGGQLASDTRNAIGAASLTRNFTAVDGPPDISQGGWFMMDGARNFTNQTFSGNGGTHSYEFRSAFNGS